MLTQILITILVIVGAVTYLRHSRQTKPSQTEKAITAQYQSRPFAAKFSVYALIAFCLLATAGLWGWNWVDDNTIVSVTISSPIEGSNETYHVRKKDIGENKITTIDGLQIRLSSQERLTISTPVK